MPTETSSERAALRAFCADVGITATTERISREAFMLAAPASDLAGDKPQRDRTYWIVTLHRDGADDFAIPYSEGSAAWWNTPGPYDHRREAPKSDRSGIELTSASICRGWMHEGGASWPCASVLDASWTRDDCKPTPPEAADLLDCMASDASGYENARDFADWCGDYGYDTDSRRAKAMYDVIAEDTRKLRRFLPADAFERLINMERL